MVEMAKGMLKVPIGSLACGSCRHTYDAITQTRSIRDSMDLVMMDGSMSE